MPNFYAHLLFGRQVSELLSPKLRRILLREWDSFCCGNFGPDPLYFYMGGKRSAAIRQAGLRIHHGSGREAMECFRRPVQQGMPYAVSFAAGYLLHYLLDSRLHPYVHQVIEGGTITHFALEGEFDRYLLLRDGRAYEDAIPEKLMPESFYVTAARMAPEVTPKIYQISLRRFRMVSCKLGSWAGGPLRYVLNTASVMPQARPVRGAILGKEPGRETMEYLDHMRILFQEAVQEAAQLLEGYFEDVAQDLPLPQGMDVDFAGKEVDISGTD